MSEITTTSNQRKVFTEKLLDWYAENRRELPWRETTDAYKVWVSEIMLQQTQVERVKDYYVRFLERFPTVETLSEAAWEEVLEYWRGLGYYNRGRKMLDTARTVVQEFGGEFPRDPAALQKLPGIGPYTAGAILSFAYHLPEPAIDTNGVRILYRVFSDEPIDQPQRLMKEWQELARELIPPERSHDFHSALMDFGSFVCTARSPVCLLCPFRPNCNAYARGDEDLQASSNRAKQQKPETWDPTWDKKPFHEVGVAIIRDLGGNILIQKRPEDKHLGGVWEFPGGKREAGEDWRACLKREVMEELGIEIAVRPVWQVVTWDYGDRVVRLRFYRCSLLRGEPTGREGQEFRWVAPKNLPELSFPPANEEILKLLAKGR